MPTLREGHRAVFFLRPGITDTSYRPIGLTLGLYRIQPDPKSGRPVVEPPVVAGRNAPARATTEELLVKIVGDTLDCFSLDVDDTGRNSLHRGCDGGSPLNIYLLAGGRR